MSNERLSQLLDGLKQGKPLVSTDLLPLVYDELRDLARGIMRGRGSSETLAPTALVNEACARLLGPSCLSWESRAHFFAVAAMAMQQVLSNHARSKRSQKNAAGDRVTLSGLSAGDLAADPGHQFDLLALDDALTKLAEFDPRKARLIELRFFGGLTMEECAHVLEVSVPTLEREWRATRAFLRTELSGSGDA